MPDKPAAELTMDAELIRTLIAEQAPDLGVSESTPIAHAADGWDCSVWRLGTDLAVRLPRRAASASLVLHEQTVLRAIADRLKGTGVGVPAPVLSGRPAHGYPWSWSIVPWFDGVPGLQIPRGKRAEWAPGLARALDAIHVDAAPGFPVNPVRGVPLAARADAIAARLASLRSRRPAGELDAVARAWDAALAAPTWDRSPVWIHGDLHPGNLIVDPTGLVAIIDFGDVTAGDPAYDLSAAWTVFDPEGRAAFTATISDRYDGATWVRARGWAGAVALLLLDQSDDNPDYAGLGAEISAQLVRDAA